MNFKKKKKNSSICSWLRVLIVVVFLAVFFFFLWVDAPLGRFLCFFSKNERNIKFISCWFYSFDFNLDDKGITLIPHRYLHRVTLAYSFSCFLRAKTKVLGYITCFYVETHTHILSVCYSENVLQITHPQVLGFACAEK